MSPYCEANGESVQGQQEYELFSVVVHSGSTHSGHYTAIIRDVDALGSWTHPVSSTLLHVSYHIASQKRAVHFTLAYSK